jgi:hypothetical protein
MKSHKIKHYAGEALTHLGVWAFVGYVVYIVLTA